jgi:diguanylate cyclase
MPDDCHRGHEGKVPEMNALVDLVAPRTWGGALIKGGIFMVLIHLLNYWVTVGLRGVAYSADADFMPTSFIALPFIAMIMAVMHHQQQLQEKLSLLASTDMLTGLPNRRAFMARTTAVTRDGQTGALMLLDADHFKKINDTYGHAVGDICLAAIATRLRANLRPIDLVGRLGGEEFSIFLPGVSVAQALVIGDQLSKAIAIAAEGLDRDIEVTLSIGAVFCDKTTPLDKLMAKADAALYRAKAEGRARMVLSA